MCGRYALGLTRSDVQQLDGYNLDIGEWVDEDVFFPRYVVLVTSMRCAARSSRTASKVLWALTHSNGSPHRYNIAPRSFAPVIRREQHRDTNIMHTMKFGLVPAWFKQEDGKLATFNARAENLVETGGLWESMKKQKRCIVVAQGSVI